MSVERPDWSLPAVTESTEPVITDGNVIRPDWGGNVQSRQTDVIEAEPTGEAGTVEFMPAELRSEWNNAGGEVVHFQNARTGAMAAINAMPEELRDGFKAGFDNLSGEVQGAVIWALSWGESGGVRHADPDEIAEFKELPEVAELATEWSGRTARKIGCINARLDRILSRLNDTQVSEATAWFEGLGHHEAKAVWRALAR